MKSISNIIEGILFLAGDSIPLAEIQEKLGISPLEISEAIEEIKKKYTDCGIQLLEIDDKIQFATNQKYADDISAVLNPIREREFSQSMLETASIVAYKQPITRLEIEKIRGVSSEYAMTGLLKQNIIETVGRKDAIGKPYLFGTTEVFLKKFNLKTISELPNYDELMKKLATIEAENESSEEEVSQSEVSQSDEIPDFLIDEPVEIIG